MIKGHVFIATSLDGFIARESGDIGWLLARDDPDEDHGYDDFIGKIDVIVMGRGSFDAIRHMQPWPYGLPVVVMSASLDPDPTATDLLPNVTISPLFPADLMASLQAQGYLHAYVDGGQIIQSFLRAGLIEDMIITSVPVLLGQGRRLFGPLEADIALIHEETRSFGSGLVQSRYRIRT